MYTIIAFGINFDGGIPLGFMLLFALIIAFYLIIYWIVPGLLGVIIVNKVYKNFATKNPNSWFIRNTKQIIIFTLAITLLVAPTAYLYRIVDSEFAKRRQENYQECIKENDIDVRKRNNGSEICTHYLHKDWKLW